MRHLLLTSALLLCCCIASAQFQGNVFVEDSSIKAFQNSQQRLLAWCGGFNNPQFATGDLNNDGKPDIVVYELQTKDIIRTFINTGTLANPVYTYDTRYAAPFRDVSATEIFDYLKLEDYNRDNIPDLIIRGMGGFLVYRGSYVQNMIHFTRYKELRYNVPSGTANAYTGGGMIPAVADVDHDSDLDFFGFYEDGSIIYFFKNCQVEHGLPNDSIEICKPTNCWGEMFQGTERTFTLGLNDSASCRPAFAAPNYDCKGCPQKERKGTLHGLNNICILDIDGDGDYDLLDGNLTYPDVQLVINGKAQYGGRDSMVAQDTLWQKNGFRAYMPTFPAIFHVDADGDGKKDILITPHFGGISENYKCVAFYKNMGTATVPNFVYQHDTFFVDRSLDFGSASYPVLYDYNKDGRPDLFVGSAGYYQPDGSFKSRISYYQNRLVGGTTRFEFQTSDFRSISAERVEGACPAFGDLDNDGLDDLLVGHADGTMFFYKNRAAANNVQPVYDPPVLLKDETGSIISPTDNVSPVIYDLNKDGRPDLLFTGQRSQVWYYENAGNAGSGVPVLHYMTDRLGNMQGSSSTPFGYATLFIGQMDNTGKDYIVLGSKGGVLRRYHGFQSGNTTVPYQLIDTMYSNIDVGTRSAAAFGDIDGDGQYEALVGNLMGGLQQYRQKLNVPPNVGAGNIRRSGSCSVYPNPAADALYMAWDAAFAGAQEVQVRLLDMTGRTVRQQTVSAHKGAAALSVSGLPGGMYLCLLRAGENLYTEHIRIGR